MMDLHYWKDLFIHEIVVTSLLEWIAVSFGVAEVLLAKANKIALYPAGIAGTLVSIYLFLVSGLYAESLLNGYYVAMSIYGWWYWVKRKNQPPVSITWCNQKEWLIVLSICFGGFVLLFIVLKNFTPSTVPFWDALISATAWAGMWLLAKRKIENWILLNISNAFAIPLLFYKHLLLYSGLTVFLFIVAVQGYIKWAKIIRTEKAALVIIPS
jgi:nicotinamide mononucleotide transporter